MVEDVMVGGCDGGGCDGGGCDGGRWMVGSGWWKGVMVEGCDDGRM